MHNKKKKEKKIIAVTCVATIAVAAGFTAMQGTIKQKEDKYVSQQTETQTETEISKDSYEIIDNKNLKEENTYIIVQKKQLSSQNIATLAQQIAKENTENFKLYIFEDKEKATNFDGSESQIEKIVIPTGNDIQIQTYNIVENEIETTPNNYEIKSVKPNENNTKIELEIEATDKPEKALAEIKFLGQSIKELNKEKDVELGNLKIQAYHIDNKNISWNYSSENKSRIIKNEIVEM